VNTVLTAIGLVVLGIPHAFVLSGIVFVCSFIPVLGVIISTVPIALSAVRAGGPHRKPAEPDRGCLATYRSSRRAR
jgi:predicted PurR-regulated permease PerM